jgi:hypothetical protein
MSKEMSSLDAMLAQYAKNNEPKFQKTEAKSYDLKNYFNTFIPDGVESGTKQVRILPTSDGSTPFVEMHAHKIKIDGKNTTLPCLNHNDGEACPFCEAYDALRATGKDSDKELAKTYRARKMYVVKVIDREKEEEGVKFWRFNDDYTKQGVYDKTMAIINALKKDITHAETGRDLFITITRNTNKIPIVSGVASLDPNPLSTDEAQKAEWLADTRTWKDVYATRDYNYLEIIVKGDTPVWDKDLKKIVGKSELKSVPSTTEAEITMGVENVKASIQTAVNMETSTSNDEDDSDDLPF